MAVTQRCIDDGIILEKDKCIYAEQEIEFLGLEIKVGQIILQKHILEKLENFPEKFEDRKQLKRFLRCLTYSFDFLKDLAKLRKSLQHKLNKDVSWTQSTNDSKSSRISKRCVKIFFF